MSYAINTNQSILPHEVPGEIRAVVTGVAQDFGVLAIRTSGWRSKGKPSIHRFNCARDYDLHMPGGGRVAQDLWRNIVTVIKQRLPAESFDVIDEWENPSSGSTAPHVHIEYDPV